ncbi:MAG: FecCD family ABC transporter permease [Spirochaetota bacterium]
MPERVRPLFALALLVTIGALAILLALSAGSTFLAPADIAGALAGDHGTAEYRILVHLRLPRILMALVVGASLSVSGAMFQSLFRNPLSDPYTVGVSGGAALGASAAIVLGASFALVAVFSFAGSLAAITLVYGLSRLRGLGSSGIILGGISLSFIFSSGVMLIFALARPEAVHKALMWLMGDLSLARYDALYRMGLFALLLLGAALCLHRHLDVISFGGDFARSLGVAGTDTRTVFWVGGLLAALSVALAGVIGFVGLIVPHAVRALVGPVHRRLLPASAAAGALFLVVCDTIGRTFAMPYEIPVGVITGFLGGIFFLVLLLKRGRSMG